MAENFQIICEITNGQHHYKINSITNFLLLVSDMRNFLGERSPVLEYNLDQVHLLNG
jgi:hypothetical protein